MSEFGAIGPALTPPTEALIPPIQPSGSFFWDAADATAVFSSMSVDLRCGFSLPSVGDQYRGVCVPG
jgi:hypothetical protein